jgi:hypothetical protein
VRRSVFISRALLVAAVGLLGLAAPVVAAQPRAVTITLVQNAETYETLGWSSSGAFFDQGSWSVDRLVLGSPRTLLFGDVETTLVGSAGTFRIDFHGGTTPVGSVAAPWRLYGGTGGYRGLKGTGAWTQVQTAPNPTSGAPALLIFTVAGTVH